jgi:hypothetical protein
LPSQLSTVGEDHRSSNNEHTIRGSLFGDRGESSRELLSAVDLGHRPKLDVRRAGCRLGGFHFDLARAARPD